MMEKLRGARFGLVSLALHGVLGILLLVHRAPPQRHGPVAIQIDIRGREPTVEPRPVTPVVPKKARPEPIQAPRNPVRQPPSPQPATPRREESPPPPGPSKPPPVTPAPPSTAPAPPGSETAQAPPPPGPAEGTPPPAANPNKVELFPSGVIGTIAVGGTPGAPGGTGKPSWLGRTRRAGDGSGDPNARDASYDREQAAAHVRNTLAELAGQERAQSGNVAPAWRDAERRLDAVFKPAREVVSDDSAAKAWAKAWLNSKPQGGATPRALDASRELQNQRYDQLLVGANSTSTGVSWQETVVEVVVDEMGQLLDAKVVKTSGRRRFDEAAREAVRRAMSSQPVKDPHGKSVARWAVSAALSVAGPSSVGFTFDESTGKVRGNYPFKKDVLTKIRLLSVIPAAKLN
ncbi:MAG TPA: TonB family protein [Polyangia bacterium]|jgi:TonB family protein|nr:TonB family protein [Polyangia bacterium]